MCCGIYQIRNIVNNKRYIGRSINLKKRKREHFLTLRNNVHKNSYLQAAYNKYGFENFVFELLEIIDWIDFDWNKRDIDRIIHQREEFWFSLFNFDELYNLSPSAGTTLGYKFSDDDRQNISNALKNSKKIHSKKRINEYIFPESHKLNISLGRLKLFEQRRKEGIETKLSETHRAKISIAVKERMSHFDARENLSKKLKGIKRTEKTKLNMSLASSNKLAVEQIDIKTNDVIKTWESITAAEMFLNKLSGHISMVCNGKRITAYGYKWRYVDKKRVIIREVKPKGKIVKQINPKTNEVIAIFKNVKAAAKFFNKTCTNNILHVCHNRQQLAYGYKWEYA